MLLLTGTVGPTPKERALLGRLGSSTITNRTQVCLCHSRHQPSIQEYHGKKPPADWNEKFKCFTKTYQVCLKSSSPSQNGTSQSSDNAIYPVFPSPNLRRKGRKKKGGGTATESWTATVTMLLLIDETCHPFPYHSLPFKLAYLHLCLATHIQTLRFSNKVSPTHKKRKKKSFLWIALFAIERQGQTH